VRLLPFAVPLGPPSRYHFTVTVARDGGDLPDPGQLL
jgi:hypothetical protein